MIGKKKYFLKNGTKLKHINIEHDHYGVFFWSIIDKQLYFLLHDKHDRKIEVIKTCDKMFKQIGNSIEREVDIVV